MTRRFRTPGRIERMLIPLFKKAGVKPAFGYGSKHPYIEWISASGELKQMFFSNSPRSAMGARSAVRKLKKMLTEEDVASAIDAELRSLGATEYEED